jgi:hypothetical protein
MGTVSTEVILSLKLNTTRLIVEILAVLWNLKKFLQFYGI